VNTTRPIYLFLDIDGVIITGQDRKIHRMRKFSPGPAAQLRRVLAEAPQTRVVLSTTKRKLACERQRLQVEFQEHGIPWERVVGRTGNDPHAVRGNEINGYAQAHQIPVEDMLVLDDETCDMLGVPPKVIFKTTFKFGLTAEIADDLVRAANRNTRLTLQNERLAI
jgi:HAD domain in Swiss Army Knife RNA repair proteins